MLLKINLLSFLIFVICVIPCVGQIDSVKIVDSQQQYVVTQMDSVTQARVRYQKEYAEFEESVRQLSDSECPYKMFNIMFDSIGVRDSYFTYFISFLSKDVRDVDFKQYMSKNINLLKDASFFGNLNRFQMGLAYHCTVTDKDTCFTVRFSHEEIQDIMANDTLMTEDVALQTLSELIRADNKKYCPMQIDEVTRLDSMWIDQNNVVYSYTIYEVKNILKFKDLKKNLETFKTNVVAGLMDNSGAVAMIALCTQVEYGILYLYVRNGHPRDQIYIYLPPEAVARIHQYHLTGE
jgi:hypothetical protein